MGKGTLKSSWMMIGQAQKQRRSTTEYCTFVWGNLVAWQNMKQSVVSKSSAEAELKALAQEICEGIWLKSILSELKITSGEPTEVHCDNQATISIAKDPIHHDQ
ncbi:hypothetical protein E5676_scaffold1280G00150 [Cucumis melo var. makuwa]|uniref:Mitochondrial protein n=1 Tax=Cucumis melo var. makuwa TaxID=1194695 RepID=A0A5A7U0L2_CUCMM|nr:hypothetical protein E6C27_scaffold83G00630 [Cucumis melo var. makuwa]TYK29743.1 hypothetical protein E5676_scaffold1280G00150 [Cucumis melo var. makuwa]